MTTVQRLDAAMLAENPGHALRAVVLELIGEGWQRPELYRALDEYLIALRSRPGHLASHEDAVLDAMDALEGWCHRAAQLLPKQPLT